MHWTITYRLVETKEEESFKVVVANTVSNPGAVVVHFGYANVAYAAVVRARWFPIATLLTVHFLVGRGRLRNHFRPLKCGDCVREQRHEDEEVEEHFDKLEVNFVGHPLIHLAVHQIERHRVETDDNESHKKHEGG